MGAKELYQWVAYYNLKDSKYKEKLVNSLLTEEEKVNNLRNILNSIRPTINGTAS